MCVYIYIYIPSTGLALLAYACNNRGYGFIELEILNSTSSTVFPPTPH